MKFTTQEMEPFFKETWSGEEALKQALFGEKGKNLVQVVTLNLWWKGKKYYFTSLGYENPEELAKESFVQIFDHLKEKKGFKTAPNGINQGWLFRCLSNLVKKKIKQVGVMHKGDSFEDKSEIEKQKLMLSVFINRSKHPEKILSSSETIDFLQKTLEKARTSEHIKKYKLLAFLGKKDPSFIVDEDITHAVRDSNRPERIGVMRSLTETRIRLEPITQNEELGRTKRNRRVFWALRSTDTTDPETWRKKFPRQFETSKNTINDWINDSKYGVQNQLQKIYRQINS